jgi:L-ascorbate metabolism protein UlaG (beta-lactamase superfamily)
MQLTYFGHACFLVEFGGKRILFDPFLTSNPVAKAAGISADSIEADYILLTHAHFDHVEDAISIAKRTGAKVVCAWEIHEWLNKNGVSNTHPMNTGGKWNFDFGTVKCVNAVHSSGLPDGSYSGNPMGFVLSNIAEGAFYVAGDTALTMDMKLLPLIAPMLKFAILPIGDNFTMGYEDAAIASDFIECNTIVGAHYDTFGYIMLDHKAATQLFDAQTKILILPEVGKPFEI